LRAVVVYESIYGNTRAVAEAIAAGLGEHADVAALPVVDAAADIMQGAHLVVVGGPTHMHGLSTCLSRRMAARAAAEDKHVVVDPHATDGPGLRAWLSQLAGAELRAAAFDTRIDRSAVLTGSAARGIARRLRSRGCALVVDPESFFVEDNEGPLADGEAARAREWGGQRSPRALRRRPPELRGIARR
jgi:Flavodoxin domain